MILAEACRNDVEAYCKDVEPGGMKDEQTPLGIGLVISPLGGAEVGH